MPLYIDRVEEYIELAVTAAIMLNAMSMAANPPNMAPGNRITK